MMVLTWIATLISAVPFVAAVQVVMPEKVLSQVWMHTLLPFVILVELVALHALGIVMVYKKSVKQPKKTDRNIV